jgi:uncharacterized membrane protein (DUF106 family)
VGIGIGTVLIFMLVLLIGCLVLAAIIRYAINTSEVHRRLEELTDEVQSLRKELRKDTERKSVVDLRV